MKFLITIFFALFSSYTIAETWEKVLVCEGGEVVVDVNASERIQLQIVFHGQEMLKRLRDFGIIDPQFGDNEAVLRGWHAGLKQESATETYARIIGGVFYPHDFQNFISQRSNNAVEATKDGDTLILKKYHVASGPSCSGSYDSYGHCYGTYRYHNTFRFLGETRIHNCH